MKIWKKMIIIKKPKKCKIVDKKNRTWNNIYKIWLILFKSIYIIII